MNRRARDVAIRVKPYVYAVAALVLLELVASTIFGLGFVVLLTIDGSIPASEVPFAIAGVVVGMNTFVLALEAVTFENAGVVLASATLLSYVLAAILLLVAGDRYDVVDVERLLAGVRS